MNILDLLTEGIGDRTLYHYTNYSGLLKILKAGHLRASLYSGGEGKQQIATARQNTKTDDEKIASLSGATGGGVKFIITADKLIGDSKVRGAKIKPIAEYPVSFAENVADLAGVTGKAKIQSFVQQLGKDIKKVIKENKIKQKGNNTLYKLRYEEAIAEQLKKMPKYSKFADKPLIRMLGNYFMFVQTTKDREGEERITFKKGMKKPNVPLDSKYIKIVLEQKIRFERELTAESRLALIKEIKKKRILFTGLPKGEKSVVDEILADRKKALAKQKEIESRYNI